MTTVDFSQVKEQVSIVDALQKLGIDNLHVAGDKLRGPCPICKDTSPRGFVVTPAMNFYYCFAEKKGGDVLTLASRVRNISLRDAALWLMGETEPAPAKVAHAPQEQREGNQPLQPLAYLEHAHDAVVAVGFDPRLAEELGIGYAGKGIMRGLVAVPIRDEEGTLIAYIGITEAKLPKSLLPPENVVPFKKKA